MSAVMFSRQILGRGARSLFARRSMCSKSAQSNKETMLYALLVASCIVTSFPILVPESYFKKADHGHDEEEEEEEEEEEGAEEGEKEEVKADHDEVEEAVAEEVTAEATSDESVVEVVEAVTADEE